MPSDMDLTDLFSDAAVKEALSPEPPRAGPPPVVGSGILFYDFETFPDEVNYPRPELPPEPVEKYSEETIDVNSLSGKKLDGAGGLYEFVEKGNWSTNELQKLRDWELARDKPRAGMIKCIGTVLDDRLNLRGNWANECKSLIANWAKSCSVNPFQCKIVAFGWAEGIGEVHSMIAKTEEEERQILLQYWKLVSIANRQRCGFNNLSYDDMVAVRRSIVLGVDPSRKLDRRKYGNNQCVDLMNLLFPNGGSQKCKDVARSVGIIPPAGETNGGDVFGLAEAGEWDKISEYVKSDVHTEREMFFRFEPFLMA